LCNLGVSYILLSLSDPEERTNTLSPSRFATIGEANRQNMKLSLLFCLTFLLYMSKSLLLRCESTGHTAAA